MVAVVASSRGLPARLRGKRLAVSKFKHLPGSWISNAGQFGVYVRRGLCHREHLTAVPLLQTQQAQPTGGRHLNPSLDTQTILLENYWVAAEATALVGAAGTALWAQLRQDARIAVSAAMLAALSATLLAFHERARRQAAQAEIVAAYGAVHQALQVGSTGLMTELQGVRGDVSHLQAAALPELVQHLRTLTAKVAALEGSTLSAGRNAQVAAHEASRVAQKVGAQAVAGAQAAVDPLRADLAAATTREAQASQGNAACVARLESRLEEVDAVLRELRAEEGPLQQLPAAMADAMLQAQDALSGAVRREVSKGLLPLTSLPAAVAGRVVDDVRAEASLRTAESYAAAVTPSAILLPDGSSAGLEWQEAVEQQAAAVQEVRAAAAEVRLAAGAPVTLEQSQWAALGSQLQSLQSDVKELRVGRHGDGVDSATLKEAVRSDTHPDNLAMGLSAQVAESQQLLLQLQQQLEASQEKMRATGAVSADAAALQQAALELRGAQAAQSASLAATLALEGRLQEALQSLSLQEGERTSSSATAPQGSGWAAEEEEHTEEDFVGDPKGDSKEAAYKRMQQLLTERNPDASSLKDALQGSSISRAADRSNSELGADRVNSRSSSRSAPNEAIGQQPLLTEVQLQPRQHPQEQQARESATEAPQLFEDYVSTDKKSPERAPAQSSDTVAPPSDSNAALAEDVQDEGHESSQRRLQSLDSERLRSSGRSDDVSSLLSPTDRTRSEDMREGPLSQLGADTTYVLPVRNNGANTAYEQSVGWEADATSEQPVRQEADMAYDQSVRQQATLAQQYEQFLLDQEYREHPLSDGRLTRRDEAGQPGYAFDNGGGNWGAYEQPEDRWARGGDRQQYEDRTQSPATASKQLPSDNTRPSAEYQIGFRKRGSAADAASRQGAALEQPWNSSSSSPLARSLSSGQRQADQPFDKLGGQGAADSAGDSQQGGGSGEAAGGRWYAGAVAATDDLSGAAPGGGRERDDAIRSGISSQAGRGDESGGTDPPLTSSALCEELVKEGLASLRAGRAAASTQLGDAERLLRQAEACFEDAAAEDPSSMKAIGNWGNALLARAQVKQRMVSEVMAAVGTSPSALPHHLRAMHLSARTLTAEARHLLLLAGRRFRDVYESDSSQTRALFSWGRVLSLRASLADTPEKAASALLGAASKFEAAAACSFPGAVRAAGLALEQLAAVMEDDDPALIATLEDAMAYLEATLADDDDDDEAHSALDACRARVAQLGLWAG